MASHGRNKRRKQRIDDTASGRALKGRGEYVLICIRDQPWLDGKWSRLIKLVQERYPCSPQTAGKAVSLAYQWLEEERAKNMPHTVGYLDRVHRYTIELGQRMQDGRIITPAAAELRKLHGIGEPDRVQLSGAVNGGMSADAQALLGALRLTNAQRLAEIDKLEAEITEAEKQQAGAPPVVLSPQAVPTTTTTEDHDGEEDEFDE